MNLNSEDQARLAQLIDRTCHEQPALKAPPALPGRVFAALERRASLPWWHKAFVYWPPAVQVFFVFVALAGTQLTLNIANGLNTRFAALAPFGLINGPWSWLQNIGALLSFLDSLSKYVGLTVLQDIPAEWLYGGMLGVLAMYALLLGVGITAYRTLRIVR